MKRCSKCKNIKEKTEFYNNKNHKDGLDAYCKSCRYEQSRDWQQQNPEQNRVLHRLHTQRLREQTIIAYGSQCRCCGESLQEFLEIHHIFNDGKNHRQQVSSGEAGSKFYRWLRDNNYPREKFCLLCSNCNSALQHYGYCPHEQNNSNKNQ